MVLYCIQFDTIFSVCLLFEIFLQIFQSTEVKFIISILQS